MLAVAYRNVPMQRDGISRDGRDRSHPRRLRHLRRSAARQARASLAALRRDGVEVKILTGDNELVARHVCEQVGLDDEPHRPRRRARRMTIPRLRHVAEQTTVFARVSPAQKNRIILALKARGHVVGYMATASTTRRRCTPPTSASRWRAPSMSPRTPPTSSCWNPAFRSCISGILEGRRAFGNVMKYLLMGTSSNFGNMFSMAGASLFLPFLPMLPTQILLNNFLYDLAQVTIPTDNVDATFIEKPQRWDMRLIRDFMIFIGPISSIYDFLTFYVLLSFSTPPRHCSTPAGSSSRWRPRRSCSSSSARWQSVTQPAEPSVDDDHAYDCAGRRAAALYAAGAVLGFTPLPLLYFLFLGLPPPSTCCSSRSSSDG